MSLVIKIRRGEGAFWGTLKALARQVLRFHLPVGAVTRPFFGALYGIHVFLREGLIWALRFWWYEPLFRSLCVAVGAGFQMEQLPYVVGRGRLVIGRGVRLSGKPTFGFGHRAHDLAEIVIGDDTFIGHGVSLHASRSVQIGRSCLLASCVWVSDSDGHPIDAVERRARRPAPPEGIRAIVIGDDVWIGTGAMVLKGVTIGDRSIVGAGAVVTRNVPPDVVVAGNPARVVKHLAASA